MWVATKCNRRPRMGQSVARRRQPVLWICCQQHQLPFLVFVQEIHIEITVGFDPVLVHLHRLRSDQSQAALLIGKIRTTRVRRLISSLSRSSMLVDLRCL